MITLNASALMTSDQSICSYINVFINVFISASYESKTQMSFDVRPSLLIDWVSGIDQHRWTWPHTKLVVLTSFIVSTVSLPISKMLCPFYTCLDLRVLCLLHTNCFSNVTLLVIIWSIANSCCTVASSLTVNNRNSINSNRNWELTPPPPPSRPKSG